MNASRDTKLETVLETLTTRHPKKIDLSLGRMEAVLKKLGSPEENLPPIIHVAGTNGKGSVVAYCRAILEAAAKRVHVYTSPHLVSFRERIRLKGQLIDEEHLISCLERVEDASKDQSLTFFEATTAAAFLAFSETPADALILEVGLGGRLDATNVIKRPAVTVISRIGLDHQEFLGRRIDDIAREKAGITKQAVPLITAQSDKHACEVLEEEVRHKGAIPIIGGQHWQITGNQDGMHYHDARGDLDLPLPKLIGPHQVENAGLAIAALRHQKTWDLPQSAFKAGLGWASWPARLQQIGKGPLLKKLPNGSVLWLDGGHNPAAAHALSKFFKDQIQNERPFYMVLGMMANKDPIGFMTPFRGFTNAVYCLSIEGENSHEPADLAATASELGIAGRPSTNIDSALEAIAQQKHKIPPVVLITGSLYLAGQVLKANGWQPT